MKKTLRIALLLMAVLVGVSGAEAKIFRFGVKAGLNITDLKLKGDMFQNVSPDNQCGWNAGLTAEVQVPVIGICADLSVLYSNLSQRMKSHEDGEVQIEKLSSNFLDIPIHLKYKFNLPVVSNIVTPMLYTGPSFAVTLGKQTFDDLKNKNCQTSWDFGLGVELFSHLQITGQYSLGMNNIAKMVATEYVTPVDVKIKSNYWTVSAAWFF